VFISNISTIMQGKTKLEAIKIIAHKFRSYVNKKGSTVDYHELIVSLGSTVFMLRADAQVDWEKSIGEEVDLVIEITTFGSDLAPTFTAVGVA